MDETITLSGGNVFADLGLPAPDTLQAQAIKKSQRDKRRSEWMEEAFSEYVKSDVEKVWVEIDGEDFIDE
jgi:hypothetical protein